MTISWEILLSVCGGITAVCAAAAWVYKLLRGAAAPGRRQNERLDAVEARQAADSLRLKAVEDGSRIIQRSLLALLAHGIDGNEIAGLRSAKEELQRYLIER